MPIPIGPAALRDAVPLPQWLGDLTGGKQVWPGVLFTLVVAVLSYFTSSRVVAEQGAAAITVFVAGGTLVVTTCLRHWRPKRISSEATERDQGVFLELQPYPLPQPGAPAAGPLPLPGRAADLRHLTEAVQEDEFRVGVLYSHPGSGKTSLLRAALVPRLREAGWTVWYIPAAGRDAVQDIYAAALAASGAVGAPAGAPWRAGAEPLPAAPAARMMIVCDGIEQLLLQTAGEGGRAQRESFFRWLHLQTQGQRVRFLLSVRTALFPDLARGLARAGFGTNADDLELPAHPLHELTPSQARDALIRRAGRAGLPLEERLIRSVVDDLAYHDVAGQPRVNPAELQLVGAGLEAQGIETLPRYRAAGGAVALLGGFLRAEVDRLNDAGQPGAAGVLRRLAAGDRRPLDAHRRRAVALEDVTRASDGQEPEQARAVLEALLEARLAEETPGHRFRLTLPHLGAAARLACRDVGWRDRCAGQLQAAAGWTINLCKSSGDRLQLRLWSVKTGHGPTNHPLPAFEGSIVKAGFGQSGNLRVVTVTTHETYLLELAATQTARARWPFAMFDGAPIDLSPNDRLLAVGFGPDGIQIYERAFWPFEVIPVRPPAVGSAAGGVTH